MGQCGCGDVPITEAYRIHGQKTVVGVIIYRGCRDCDYGPGVSFCLFDRKRSPWLDGVKLQSIKPDEYGSRGGTGISIGIFDVRDVVSAAKEMAKTYGWPVPIDVEQTPAEAFESWMEEVGSELLGLAMFHREKRVIDLSKRG